MYDVRYLNKAGKAVGIATDCTTPSRRDALDRAHTLRSYGIPAHVTNQHGYTITDGMD